MMTEISAPGDLIVATSDGSWAGTCRTFDTTLNDGSSHQALFRFVR